MHVHLASLAPAVPLEQARVFDSAAFATAADRTNKRNHGRR